MSRDPLDDFHPVPDLGLSVRTNMSCTGLFVLVNILGVFAL